MRHSCGTLLGHSCLSLLWGTTTKLLKSHVKSAKQAFRTRLLPKFTRQVSKTSVSHETSSSKSHTSSSPKHAFRTRHPPKVTRQVSKTRASYETSSKSHMSRDVKVSKTSISHETVFLQKSSGKPHRNTHQAALPSSFATPAPPAHTPIALPHLKPRTIKALRLPGKVTKSHHASCSKICATPRVRNDFDTF